MSSYITHEADGFDFICPVTFDAASGVTTLIGATVAVDAIELVTRAKIAGTATVLSATTIRCTFAAWALPAANYSVQVRAKPSGYADQTVLDETLWVKQSAAVTP